MPLSRRSNPVVRLRNRPCGRFHQDRERGYVVLWFSTPTPKSLASFRRVGWINLTRPALSRRSNRRPIINSNLRNAGVSASLVVVVWILMVGEACQRLKGKSETTHRPTTFTICKKPLNKTNKNNLRSSRAVWLRHVSPRKREKGGDASLWH